MAYSKLTQSWLDDACATLDALVCRGRELAARGISYRLSIRGMCCELGLSHMTYYRWMRAYHALSGDFSDYTDTERRLFAFGSAMESALSEFAGFRQVCSGLDVGSELRSLMKSVDREGACEYSAHAKRRAKRDKQLTAWERKTCRMSRGRGYVSFASPRFTKKRVK